MDNEKIFFAASDLLLHISELDVIYSHKLRNVHFHNAVELVYVNQGEIICTIDNREIILREKQLLLINKRVVHKLSFYESAAKITYIQIDIDKYAPDSIYPINTEHLSKYGIFDTESELYAVFSDIVSELQNRHLGYKSYLKSDILRIAAFMTRNNFILENNAYIINKDTKIMTAIAYINEHYNSKIYLDEVSQVINIDKFYLCKLFKQVLDMTFIEYVNLIRLTNAEQHLLNSDKSVSEIAFECGFSSTQYFGKLFKKRSGCSPKEYRKLYRAISF